MDLVAAAFREGFDQAGDGDSGLQGVVSGDQADVPAADDEQAAGGADQVPVDERLEGAGPVNAGKGVAGEGQGFFPGSRGHEKDFRIHLDIALPIPEDADLLVAVDGQGGALKPSPDAGISPKLVFELGGDVDAAGSGEHCVIGAEEPVGLEDKLAAEAVLVVDEKSGNAALAEFDRGRQAGRAAADDENGDGDFLDGRKADRA